METVKLASLGLLALFNSPGHAEPPGTPAELQPPPPSSIVWETSWPGCVRAGNCLVGDISFSEAYPKAFYKTDKFTYTLIAASMATAATVTVMTAGVGAPAVVPGTSSLIVLVGGGSQGAYMAGLSTIGSLIGSNAVGGAAIINSFGAAIGFSAVAKKAAFGGLALKEMLGVSAAAYDGILIAENKQTEQLTFITELRIPTKLGSNWVRELVDRIYENEEKAFAAKSEENWPDFEWNLAYQQADLRRGVRALESCWTRQADGGHHESIPNDLVTLPIEECASEKLTRDDLITLSVVAYKAGRFDLFQSVIAYVKQRATDNDGGTSFLDYLYATSLLMQSEFSGATQALLDAIDQEPNVIEPALLYIVYLAETDFAAHEADIESRVRLLKDQFDEDEYETGYSLATVYFRLGNIYAENGRYQRAIQYFEDARKALNFTQKWPIFAKFMNQQFRQDIELPMAISHFRTGNKSKAEELFNTLYQQETDDIGKKSLKRTYLCSTTPELAKDECKRPAQDGHR